MATLAEIERAAAKNWLAKPYCAGHLVELQNETAKHSLDVMPLTTKTLNVTLKDIRSLEPDQDIDVMVVGEMSKAFTAAAQPAGLRVVHSATLGGQKICDVVGAVPAVEVFLEKNRALIRNDRLLCAHYA